MIRRFIPANGLILLFLLTSFHSIVAQQIFVDAEDIPLSLVLLEIQENYDIEFSFDHDELKKYNSTVAKEFSSPEKAINYLLKDFPLSFEKIEDTYVIFPDNSKSAKAERIIISGVVQDYYSSEPLPYVSLQINQLNLTTDQLGRFSCRCDPTDSVQVKVSYLGYYQLDTTLRASDYLSFKLYPRNFQLQEVVLLKSQLKIDNSIVTDYPGKIKINPLVAKSMPGYGDNSIYTCLSVIPGVQAFSNASDGLIVWGIPEEQNNIRFDGIKIFSINRYFNQIGTINPMLVKDIELYKSGGNARFGDIVGSMLNFTSLKGNEKPSYTLNINNTTINALIEQPIKDKSFLVLAARKTYFNLLKSYETDEGGIVDIKDDSSANYLVNSKLRPEYHFQDIYAKYSYQSEKDHNYSISLYYAADEYAIDDSSGIDSEAYGFKSQGINKNIGASVFASGRYIKNIQSSILISFSALDESVNLEQSYSSNYPDEAQINETFKDEYINTFQELQFKLDNRLPVSKYQSLQFGIRASHVNSEFNLQQDSVVNNKTSKGNVFAVYIEDDISFSNKFRFIPGLRVSSLPALNKFYFEPRVSGIYSPLRNLKIKAHSGMYTQTTQKEVFIDEWDNYFYYWAFTDANDKNPLKSVVYSLGFSLGGTKHLFDVEFYNKKIEGIKIPEETESLSDVYYGSIRTRGVDLIYKIDLPSLSTWISCSYNKAIISFSEEDNLVNSDYEFKWVGIKHIKRFSISADYIYSHVNQKIYTTERYKFSKFDISTGYTWTIKNIRLETGISVLNLFNSENLIDSYRVKYSYRNEHEINYLQYGLPRTITAYLKVNFTSK